MIQIAEKIKVEENYNQKAIEIIAQCTKTTAEKMVSEAPYNKTFFGKIKQVLFDNTTLVTDDNYGCYIVSIYGGGENRLQAIGMDYKVGDEVKIDVINNNTRRIDTTYSPYMNHKPYKVTFGQTSIIVIFSNYVNHEKDITRTFPVTRDISGNIQTLTYPNGNVCEVTW